MLMVLVHVGCGQRTLPAAHDSGAAGEPALDGGATRDAAPPPGCSALACFKGGKRLTPLHAEQALFSPTLDRVLIVTHAGNDPGDLLAISLPHGTSQLLDTAIHAVEWLGHGTQLLASRNYSHKTYHYDLRLIPTSGAPETLATGICSHRASPDGTQVWVVRNCQEHEGTLEILDLQSGGAQWVEKKVHAYGLAPSPDSQRMGFFSNVVDPPPGCLQRGSAWVADRSGHKELVTQDAVSQSLQFLDASTLLYGIEPFCDDALYGYQLVACDFAGQFCTLVGSSHEYGFPYHQSPSRYETSVDGALVLGATSDPQGYNSQLHAMRTDGLGQQLLAGDLFPYMSIAAVYDPWGFTASGKHVVYTHLASSTLPPYTMGLSAVPSAGGEPVRLTSKLFFAAYQVSPRDEEVAFVEQTGSDYHGDGMALKIGSPGSGAVRQVLSSQQSLGMLRYLPDGRGLLLIEHPTKGGHTRLRYVARLGGASKLGEWNQTLLSGTYQVDPGGCAVLFDSDLDGGGTHLALLP